MSLYSRRKGETEMDALSWPRGSRTAPRHGTFNFLINQSTDARERLSLSVERPKRNGRPRIWSITKIPPRSTSPRASLCAVHHIRNLVALFCSNRRKFNYMILAFHEDTFCDNVQSVEKRGMKFRRPLSSRNLCRRDNNRNGAFKKSQHWRCIYIYIYIHTHT